MEKTVINEATARKFLLGDIPGDEREQIQELAFEDPDAFSLIQAAQEDLLDDFINDELTAEEKERFQNYFLAQPGRRQDLSIAQALHQYWARDEPRAENVIDNDPSKLRRKFSLFDWFRLEPARLAWVLLIVVAATVIPILILTRQGDDPSTYVYQPPPSPSPVPSVSPAVTPQATPSATFNAGTPSPSPRQPLQPSYAVLLVPGGPVRSEGEGTKVAPVSGRIKFELPLIDQTPYRSYRAELQHDERTIKTWTNLHPRELQAGRGFEIVVAGGLLTEQQSYKFILTAVAAGKSQIVHTYYFTVSN